MQWSARKGRCSSRMDLQPGNIERMRNRSVIENTGRGVARDCLARHIGICSELTVRSGVQEVFA
jgi:hypothetical protein